MKIEILPSGTYRARVYIGKDESGKAIYKSITDPDRYRLKEKIAELEAKKARGSIRKNRRPVTIGDAVAGYISQRKAVLSPATIRGYLTIQRTLETEYRAISESRCELADIQGMISDMARCGKSPKTIRNTASLIRSAAAAYEHEIGALALPQRKKADYHIPTEDEIRRLLVQVNGTPLDVAVHLGICGLRRSEICGINGDDVIGKNKLHIQRAMVKNPDGGWIIKGTKTYNSDRIITIPEEVAAKIKSDGVAYRSVPTALSDNFAHAVKRAGLPHFRFHDLRHFFASYAHNILKLSDKQIQQLGGWKSNYTLQSVYEHSMHDSEAGDAVVEALKRLDG